MPEPDKKAFYPTDSEFRACSQPRTIDNTMRVLIDSCPRKFYWTMRGYEYGDVPPYFIWGRAYAVGVNILDERTDLPPLERIALAVHSAQSLWDREGGVDNGLNKRDSLQTILQSHFEHYPSEGYRVVKEGIELGWQWPLLGTDYYLAGSYDAYIDLEPYGPMPKENKTTGQYLSTNEIQKYDLSTQVTGYIWNNVQINGPEANHCLVHMATKNVPGPKSKWTTPRFARTLQKRSPRQLEEFIVGILDSILKLETCWKKWHWPMTSDLTLCFGGGGKAPCLFNSVCRVDAPF
ncbi:MAG: hypothetical protein ACWGQW_26335, partial [bacterium]